MISRLNGNYKSWIIWIVSLIFIQESPQIAVQRMPMAVFLGGPQFVGVMPTTVHSSVCFIYRLLVVIYANRIGYLKHTLSFSANMTNFDEYNRLISRVGATCQYRSIHPSLVYRASEH